MSPTLRKRKRSPARQRRFAFSDQLGYGTLDTNTANVRTNSCRSRANFLHPRCTPGMGLSASGLRADWRQHDDARPSPAFFHAPLESNRRAGRPVFLPAIFRQLSGYAGDQLAAAPDGIFESD